MRRLVLRYSRVFPHPLADTFAWLTDYTDDDPNLTDAVIVSRPVVEKTPNRVVLDGTLNVLGSKARGRAVVTIEPPDTWVADFAAKEGKGSQYRYRLTSVPGGSRLDVEYDLAFRRTSTYIKVFLLQFFILRELDRMWAGFARSMAKDLAPMPAAA